MKETNWPIILGAAVLLLFIFGIPAVLVPTTMDNVPERSKTKVLTYFQHTVGIVEKTFERHRQPAAGGGRLAPLPNDTVGWIELVNPTGRRAPGGGPALMPEANDVTGAVGISGDDRSVTVTLPAYADLERYRHVVRLAADRPSTR